MFGTVIVATIAIVMMPVMVTMGVRIIFQRSGGKSLCGFVRRSLYSGVERNARVRERHLGSHADTTADQGIYFGSLQKASQRTMATAIGIYNLFAGDFTGLDVIQFELFGMSEMLEDLSVLIRDCDSHSIVPFLHNGLINLYRLKCTAPTCYQQPLSMYERIRNFLPRAVVDCRNRGTCDIHLGSAGFLREALVIQKSQSFILIHRHSNNLGCRYIIRGEAAIDRHLSNSPASDWSCHSYLLSDICQ